MGNLSQIRKKKKVRMLPRIAHGVYSLGFIKSILAPCYPPACPTPFCELLSPALTRREHIVSSKYDTFLNNIYTRSISTRATIW